MDSRHETKIRDWMLATISNGGIDRLDDLHVDDIDENWKQRAHWISASIRAYELAVRLQSNLGLSVKVALAFSLLDGMGQTFDTEEEFQSQLDCHRRLCISSRLVTSNICPTLFGLIRFRRLSRLASQRGPRPFFCSGLRKTVACDVRSLLKPDSLLA